MKKTILLLLTAAFCGSAPVYAQTPNIINTVCGTGISGYTGDGGPATAAELNQATRVAIDGAGNQYICDVANNRIRKVDNSTGIITTIAGNGTMGFSGDGGPAVSAELGNPDGIALDAAGNIYIADQTNNRIRMINTSGIISTIAGNGTIGYTGDGGPATNARIHQPGGVFADGAGNIYFVDLSNTVRKINSSGIISTVAGTGVAGFSGDGGPATAAQVNQAWGGIIVDAYNNIYFSDQMNNRIRKIDPSGIITTIAGNGTAGYAGDGGPAIAAEINYPEGIAIDPSGNLYFCDRFNNVLREINAAGTISTICGNGTGGFSGDGGPANAALLNAATFPALDLSGQYLYIADAGNDRIRKMGIHVYDHTSDSLTVGVTVNCMGGDFYINTRHYTPGTSVVTTYGDGATSTSAVSASAIGTGGYVVESHNYTSNGTYTVKHVLMEGGAGVDSVSYSYDFRLCNIITASYYLDNNNDCIYEPGTDNNINLPIYAEIDSNGVAVDTLVSPGGISYKAYGNPGDIYTVRIFNVPSGLSMSCPSTGLLYDTLQLTSSSIGTNYFGFNCSSTTGFDLFVHATSIAGRHACGAFVLAGNLYCTPEPGTLHVEFSPKYGYAGGNIAPTTSAVNFMSWDFASLTSADPMLTYITAIGSETASSYYTPGDTANSYYNITPTTSGDLDMSNNDQTDEDTITASFDPNFMTVSPGHCIPAGVTELEYAIGFENTGNDTAFNIFIMDTLSNDLDWSTLVVEAASANMNLTKIKGSGGQHIVKFSFPGINLLDSNHSRACTGVMFYKIKTNSLVSGNIVANRAGIYFDGNAVVMTNEADNTVGCTTSGVSVAQVQQTIKTGIYPNPATDVLTIQADNTEYTTYTISNNIGQVLLQSDLAHTQTAVDVKSLPAGMYYVTLKGDNGSVVKKFVKM